jgi:adenylate cyclase
MLDSLNQVNEKKIQWGLALVVFLLAIVFCQSPTGESLERFVYDAFFRIRGALLPDPRFVIVAIDEPSFGVFKEQWPWPRSRHARLLKRLFEDGAAAVALDIVFADPSKEVEDEALDQALSDTGPVVLGAQIERSEAAGYIREMRIGPPARWLHSNVNQGGVNLPVDPDGFIRNVPLQGRQTLVPFAMSVANAVCSDSPASDSMQLRIPFTGPPGTIPSVSYYQALLPGHLPKKYFKNKIVFVGFLTQNSIRLEGRQPDHFPVPYTRWGYGYMAGVEIQAQLVLGICNNHLIRIPMRGWVWLLHSVVWIIGGLLFFTAAPGRGAIYFLLSCFSAVGCAYGLFVFQQIAWPMIGLIIPLTALYGTKVGVHYLKVRREKQFIRQAFSTYVSPELVSQLVRERKSLHLGGEETEITAFFSDIQGFTTISEKLTPRELVALLNDYLTEMTDILLQFGGTVDKFEGDAIVAFFGAPTALSDHAVKACQCALAMQERLAELKTDWAIQGRPELYTRIGLCTGMAVVGNMGSKNRLDYTMMGDTPNTASRLEGANKIYGTKILVSDETASVATSIRFREVDKVRLKGKKQAVTLHEPFGLAGEMAAKMDCRIETYQTGLNAYRQGEWEKAIGFFNQVLYLCPDDGPSQAMKARCEEFFQDPPLSWDGVYILTEK